MDRDCCEWEGLLIDIRIQPGDFKCGSFVRKISQFVTEFNDQHHMSIYYVVVYIDGKSGRG